MPIHFEGFNCHADVRIYRRHLPHWRQVGATYFVTCRLADSLPEHLLIQLDVLRRALSIRQADEDGVVKADREYFQAMKQYLDIGHGECWLRMPELRDLVSGAYRHFDGERYELGEFVVMPNHTHVLVRPLPGFELEEILHSWKSHTGRQINSMLRRKGPVWQEESYDRIVRDGAEFARTGRYIRNNALPPEKRGRG